MATYDLGKVVGDAGEKGDDGSTVWNTSTAPTYANSKYTFNISNLSGKTGLEIAVNDIIFYSTYYYIVSAVNTTTVDCSTRVSIKGSDASVTIVDNLTSDSSTSVLSAKQGKVLNTNKIETSAIATSFGSTTSDSKVPSEKLVKTELDKKIATSNTAGLVKNDGTIDTTSYSTFSGSYNDLSNKPTIPSSSSDLSDGSSLVKTSSTTGLLKNDGSIMTSGTGSSNYSAGNHTHSGYVSATKVTSWQSTPSDSNVPSEKLVKNSLDSKADSSDIPTKISDLTNDSDFIETSSTSGLIKNDGTIDTTSYSTFSGSYNDLSDKPSSFTPSSHTHGNLTNDGKVGSTANYFVYTTTGGAITSKQKIGNITTSGAIGSTANLPVITGSSGALTTGSFGTTANTFAEGNHTHSAYVNPTKVTSWSSTPSNDNVASEKLIKDSLDTKQATLVSGTTIKTINSESILGSGDIVIQGGGSGGSCVTDFYIDSDTDEWVIETSACSQGEVVTTWSSTLSDTKVPSEKLIKEYVDDLVGDAVLYITGNGN